MLLATNAPIDKGASSIGPLASNDCSVHLRRPPAFFVGMGQKICAAQELRSLSHRPATSAPSPNTYPSPPWPPFTENSHAAFD